MAEAFVRTTKRDYAGVSPRPDARAFIYQIPNWMAHYNHVHPHRTLGYRSPREFIALNPRPTVRELGDNNKLYQAPRLLMNYDCAVTYIVIADDIADRDFHKVVAT